MIEIWILAEHDRGAFAPCSFELLGEAGRLGKKLAGTVAALVLADDDKLPIDVLGHYGADKVYLIEDPRLRHYDPAVAVASIARLCRLREPFLMMFPATSTGSDVAARLAVSQGWSLVPHCINIQVRGDAIEFIRPLAQRGVHGVFTASQSGPRLVTFVPDTLGVERPEFARQTTLERVPAEVPEHPEIEVCGFITADPRTLDLSEAEIVVAAGRGVGSLENMRFVEELAAVIGGSVAGTRPVVDLGWLPHARQIGQTGTSVRPRLYVACGISGAAQHVVGIRDAGTIVAVNTDRGAPIFEIADLGIVDDVTKVLPLLTQCCRAFCRR